LGKGHNTWYYAEALKPEDFAATPQGRFEVLTAYGNSGNALARSSVMNFLGGYGLISQEMHALEGIATQSYLSLLRWVSQGDFSLIQGVFHFLQEQKHEAERETISATFKAEYIQNLFLLYKIFVSPTLEDFKGMVGTVLRNIEV
jgi:hypothetical protein